jgi:DNA repair protein RadD
MIQELQLWPVQVPVYEDLLDAYASDCRHSAGCNCPPKHTNVFVQAPTGFGKTTIFTKMVAGAYRKKTVTYIVAHTNPIIDQISERLKLYGIPHSFIAAGYRHTPWEPIQVCMVQSLKPRLLDGRVPQPELVIIDEAHHCTASNYDPLFDIPGAHVVMVSATPWRLDGIGFTHRATKLICGPTVKYLFNTVNPMTGRTYLVPPKVYGCPEKIDTSKIGRTKDGEYKEKEAEAAIEKAQIFGSALTHYKMHCHGQTAVYFCQSVRHSDKLADEFTTAGVACKAIHGDKTKQEINQTLKELAQGKIFGLAVCEMAGEGFDLPLISAIFFLRLTRSLSKYLQGAGRAMRGADGKTCCLMFDHVGAVQEFGHPGAPRTWSLEGKTEIIDDGEADMRQCEKCYLWISEYPCEQCGHTPKKGTGSGAQEEPTVNKYGMLVLLDEPEAPAPKKPPRKMTRSDIGVNLANINNPLDWHRWAKANGYTPAWANIQWGLKMRRVGGKK